MPAFELNIDAVPCWTKRGLTDEVSLEVGGKFFVQLTVPANSPVISASAEDLGFRNAELRINTFIDLTKATLYQQYVADGTHALFPNLDSEGIIFNVQRVTELAELTREQIIQGATNAFSSDRFHTDPNCSNAVADARIGMWLEADLLTNPAMNCTTLSLGKDLVGYIIWKDSEFILGGITPHFIGRGFAKLLYLQTMADVHRASQVVTATISANNIEVLNLYSRLEYSFEKPSHVYHLWGKSSEQ
jgi:hypothetical protein